MPGRLLRVFGAGFGVAVAVGATVGSGILGTPGEVVGLLGNPTLVLLAWAAGGAYAFLGACSMAELGAMIPRAGGFTVFARRALGPYPGFLVGWTDWLVADGSMAAVALIAAESLGAVVAGLAPLRIPLAIAFVMALAGVQIAGVGWSGRLQNVATAAKAVALCGVGVACFVLPGAPPSSPAVPQAGLPVTVTLAGAVGALAAVIFSYDGWYGVVLFGEELRDPGRQAPRALFGSVALLTVLYVGFNAALLHALPPGMVAGHPLAGALAAETVFGHEGDTIFRAVVVVSALGSMGALQLGTPRILFALGRDSRFAGGLARVSTRGTPTTALLLSVLLEIAFIALGGFKQVVAVLAVFMASNYALTFVSVFVLRRREPEVARPFRAWGYPWTTAAALAGALAFVVSSVAADTRNALVAAGVLAASYPLFRVTRGSGVHD